MDSLINYLDKFGPELLVIQFGFLVILSTLFMWLWFSNRRKYHNLKHAIPANVVKSYLDSIIQNSTSLKSSLFRGGGLEVNGVPSVMPLQNLGGGEGLAVNGAPSTALMEELNQKKALIASLEAQLSSSQNSQREVEAKFSQAQGNLAKAEARIKELEELIAQLKASAGNSAGSGDAVLKSELQMITKERDEIKDRLKEFEIISDDLANLKRLQQENEQLKRSLAAQGGVLPAAAAAAEPVAKAPTADVSDLLEDITEGSESGPESSEETQVIEDFLSAAEETEEPASEEPASEEDTSEEEMMAAVKESGGESEEDKSQSERTPEDLLSEFEKMLG